VLRAELARGAVDRCDFVGVVASRSEGPDACGALAAKSDVLIEAAGVPAVAPLLEAATRYGCTLVVCSTGAFAEPDLERWLNLPSNRDRVILPSGAIGGIDLLTSVVRSGAKPRVTLVTAKQPAALSCDGDTGRRLLFSGTAREAARRFPKTSNVAATLALAGGGFDDMTVQVIADPAATRTRHDVTVDSDLGSYHFAIENALADRSGARTSAVTIWSVLLAVEQAARRLTAPKYFPRNDSTTQES